jgi:hypothetical protein
MSSQPPRTVNRPLVFLLALLGAGLLLILGWLLRFPWG